MPVIHEASLHKMKATFAEAVDELDRLLGEHDIRADEKAVLDKGGLAVSNFVGIYGGGMEIRLACKNLKAIAGEIEKIK